MAFNETSFHSFINFLDDSGRINHFFYKLLWMYPIFITIRRSNTVNQYTPWNASPNTWCDVGSNTTCITFLTRNIHGDFSPEHRIPYNLVVTTSMFCVYRRDVCR